MSGHLNFLIKRMDDFKPSNTQLKNVGDFVSIICAICIDFRPPIINKTSYIKILSEKMMKINSMK